MNDTSKLIQDVKGVNEEGIIQFEEIPYELPLNEDSQISDTYTRLVQKESSFHPVNMTLEDAKESVMILSRFNKRTTK